MDWILHVDLDQFVAAVEVNRRPELRGLPVVVGTSGDPTRRRAVVTTASYEGRRFGVRSGMPLRTAARRCPEATFLESDPPAYEAASAQVMATLRAFPVQLEVLGWDEAFLGASTDDAAVLAAEIRAAVLAETGLSCSVGIGDNKLRAKIATGFAKPAGIFRLTRDDWMAVMGERPVQALWGIGSRMSTNLAEMGLLSVAELAAADPARLVERFGPVMGRWYQGLALGEGGTEIVTSSRVPRSHSRETTFLDDLTEPLEVEGHVSRLAAELAAEAAAEGRAVTRVAVKIRFAPFFTQIRSHTLSAPTDCVPDVQRAARVVLDRFDRGRPVRLIGVRVEFDLTAASEEP